jgi:anti-sigma-K factor RskA
LTNNLPVPANDKQYQLWAIFNGKPVDLGVFDIKKERLLIQARNTQGAEAFAITMEKKGGSPSPEGTMYVMGKI